MNYLHRDKTIAKAREFSEYLNKHEFRSVFDADGTRDYLSKIDVHAAGEYIGKVNLYFSPKKNTYKITCQSIHIPSYRDLLQEHWHRFMDSGTPSPEPAETLAYVDGSFMNGIIGYGAVILRGNKIIHEISGKMDDQFNAHHQIGGELKAVIETVQWCLKEGIKDIHIYYDYQGIEMWARAKWKAKTPLTQKYQAFMIKQPIIFHFHKIKAHTGNRWNEYADQLAKKGSNTKNGETV